VLIWDASSWKQLAQARPLQKASCHSVGFAPWGGAGLGVHPSLVLCTGGAPVGWGGVCAGGGSSGASTGGGSVCEQGRQWRQR
jgi:hypothetical protein